MSEPLCQRPTRIVVDLDAVGGNLRAIRQRVGVPVMAIVKANAYGHGLVPVARHLLAQGAEQLGVAFVEEGEALRNDAEFSYVAAWEFTGVGNQPVVHKEPLTFNYVKPTQRSYK